MNHYNTNKLIIILPIVFKLNSSFNICNSNKIYSILNYLIFDTKQITVF